MTHFKKIFIAGANGMLGTTLQNITDTSDYLLTDKEIGIILLFVTSEI